MLEDKTQNASPLKLDYAAGEPTDGFPLLLKLLYTAFVRAHVFFNWRAYGPVNFLWECDVAVLMILLAIWTESRLITSIAAVAALLPMGLWIFDLAGRVLLGHYLFGFAGYMFDKHVPRVIRVISGFHVWLPPLLVWMVWRVGYDRRAFAVESMFMTVLLIVSWLISKPPPPHQMHELVNLNWVYGPSDTEQQTKVAPVTYLGIMIILYPLLIYYPTHMILSLAFGKRRAAGVEAAAGKRHWSRHALAS